MRPVMLLKTCISTQIDKKNRHLETQSRRVKTAGDTVNRSTSTRGPQSKDPKRRSQPRSERVLASNAHLYRFIYILLNWLSFLFMSRPIGGEAMTSFKMCPGWHATPALAPPCNIQLVTTLPLKPIHFYFQHDKHQ